MKCLVIAYLTSDTLIETMEAIMEFQGFTAIETNINFRVFSGHFQGSISRLAYNMNKELAGASFAIEDSLFIVYPTRNQTGHLSLSNIIIKRKGNKYLRTGIGK